MARDTLICVGMLAGAHGVRGLVRLRSFTEDPDAITQYKPLTDESGTKTFALTIKSTTKDFFIAELEGSTCKEDADALRGVKLYVPRAVLPKPAQKEYYEADLIGLLVMDLKGCEQGRVLAVHDYGAGTFLEIGKDQKTSYMLPFTEAYVPEIKLKAGQVIVDPPEGWS